MDYTYREYEGILKFLANHGYVTKKYGDTHDNEKEVILRHDVDISLDKAVRFAELEKTTGLGYSSTYFVLISSDFYNPLSRASIDAMKRIRSLDHDIGLHFDEQKYCGDDDWNQDLVIGKILEEKKQLESIIEDSVNVVSMHRPSRKTLEANLLIPGMINSYGGEYFNDIKYVSDSYHRWRENVYQVIETGTPRIQLLTHAFWYNNKSLTRSQAFRQYMDGAKEVAYKLLEDNILPAGVTLAESFAEEEGL